MIEAPFFKNISSKLYDSLFVSLIILMYVACCAEADIYVPTFPEMVHYFKVQENQIQLILSINFMGLCIAGLGAGPLSDSYGRRKVVLSGLLLFVLGSLGCVYATTFEVMLFWRLIQGIAASVPMVIGCAMIIDKYPPEKAGQKIGVINGMISASMAGAPIAGAWISQLINWRANFGVILGLSLLSFLGTYFFIEETLPASKRKEFNVGLIGKDYTKLLKSPEFIGYTLIVNFPFAAIVVYIANLSIILINHLNIPLETFGYYQASTMVVFVLFSFSSVFFIRKKGLDFTQNFGGFLALFGALSLFYVGLVYPQNAKLICLAMAFVAAGGSMMPGTFGVKGLSLFPEINGTALALMTAFRQLFAAGMVVVSEYLFDGTITPVAQIIMGYAGIAALSYGMILFIQRTKKSQGALSSLTSA